jgi:hypothetical protein
MARISASFLCSPSLFISSPFTRYALLATFSFLENPFTEALPCDSSLDRLPTILE